MMTIMDAIEAAQRRGIAQVARDFSNDEAKTKREEQEEQVTVEERMIRAINTIGCKPRLDTLIYSRNLNLKELIDLI